MGKRVIGKYIRLSQADRDLMVKENKAESESISHQKALIQNFISGDPELAECEQYEFFDDGYSGTNFERPSFERLLEKIKNGAINCVIVKDFSRFGRDYIELGDYLERIFPFLGVRFISINDHYDSQDYKGTTGGLDVVMKNIVYDYYSKDYEIRLQQALEENLLCPFHYFGITDLQIDGETIDENTGLKDFNKLTSDERVSYVIKQIEYYGYCGKRPKGLIFCSSKKEACILSEKFNERGYRTLALTGDDSQEKRERAVERLVLEEGADKLDYILTVDIFNEGVDIPEVNQIIMLRPTQSPIIFVQQLGRGLRKAENKEYVVILDFIGNYKNNFMIPIALSGDRSYNKDNIRRYVLEELDTEIEVKDFLETVEYDYPEFHLSMDCFFCTIKSGELVLKEHEAAKWLTAETLDSVDWLPADQALVQSIKKHMEEIQKR